MENASKALIIAGSVLVAILIIAMGVAIFNKAQKAGDTSSLDTTEINMFNQKFERYNNTQLGSQVKSLISFAISNASTNKDDQIKLPTVRLIGTARNATELRGNASGGMNAVGDKNETYIGVLGGMRNEIVSTHPYTITIGYGNSGIIETITITW